MLRRTFLLLGILLCFVATPALAKGKPAPLPHGYREVANIVASYREVVVEMDVDQPDMQKAVERVMGILGEDWAVEMLDFHDAEADKEGKPKKQTDDAFKLLFADRVLPGLEELIPAMQKFVGAAGPGSLIDSARQAQLDQIAETLALLTNLTKAKHETAKGIIANLRA
ncbi:MAG: hypothetical protein ABI743_00890 [bacterium]